MDGVDCLILDGDELKKSCRCVTRRTQKSCDRLIFLEEESMVLALVEIGPHTMNELGSKFQNSVNDGEYILETHHPEATLNTQKLYLNVLHGREIERKRNMVIAMTRGTYIRGFRVYPAASGMHLREYLPRAS